MSGGSLAGILKEIEAGSGNWSPEASSAFKAKAKAVSAAPEADLLLGVIAGLDGDLEEMERRLEGALANAGGDPALLCQCGKALYNAGDFSRCVQALMPVADEEKEAALLMGLACRALGLERKAGHYLRLAGADPGANPPASPRQEGALREVRESFERDMEIWRSLSIR